MEALAHWIGLISNLFSKNAHLLTARQAGNCDGSLLERKHEVC
jgi:hypothetical protein